MSPSRPFIDAETGGLDTDQIKAEAYPLAGLIALFAGLSLIPFLLGIAFYGGLSLIFWIVGELVLAVGAGIVLIYAVARGIQLSGA